MKAFYGVNSPEAVPEVQVLLFDTFGTLVDWRSSLIAELSSYGMSRGISADWELLVDEWRSAYYPSMDRVRRGEQPWTRLDDLHRQSLENLVEKHDIRGVSGQDLSQMNRAWHRLRPWSDVPEGMAQLAVRYLLGSLSNGNLSLLVRLRKFAGLPWDVVLGADLWRHYKPDPEVYRGACQLLDVSPNSVMLVAAHNDDLRAARAEGLCTAFIPRPGEYGPRQVKDFEAEEPWTAVALDLTDLARQLSSQPVRC